MERLFSYGTLQLKSVQLETFGRELTGAMDILPGYIISEVRIDDPEVVRKSGKEWHPILRPTGDPSDEVAGTVFEITAAELVQADAYEVDAYRRVRATFKSGDEAWAYVAADCLPRV